MSKNSFMYFLSKYFNDYLRQTLGSSENTIKAYSDTFKLLFTFAKEKYSLKPQKIRFETINKKFVMEFLNWIISHRQCGDATRNLRLSNIKAFFSYVQSEVPSMTLHVQSILQIPKKKLSQEVTNYITSDGIKLILSQPNQQTSIGKKHLVLLSFMYATGARVQEVIDACIVDFKYNGCDCVRLHGKGNKDRLVPLENGVIQLLQQYLEYEKSTRTFFNPGDSLFLNQSKIRFTRQGISYIVNKYAQMAKDLDYALIPSNVHPHVFRHSRAMALLHAGIELIYIRDFLGHYSVMTTEIYARTNNETIRKALLKIAPSQNTTQIPIWEKDKNLLEFLKSLSQE